MNILIITLQSVEARTSAMLRTLAITRGLHEDGHTVDLLCITDNGLHPNSREPDFLRDMTIIRTPGNSVFMAARKLITSEKRSIKQLAARVARRLWHLFCVYDNTIRIVDQLTVDLLPRREYDIILSSSDPKSSHLAAKKLIRGGLTYRRWIQYWGDPMALDISRESVYPRFVMKRIEMGIIKRADRVVYVSPFTLEKQQRLMPKYADKMVFSPIPYVEEKRYSPTENTVFTLGYYGNYDSKVRDLRPFYEACLSLDSEIHVDIVGDSDLTLSSTEHINILPRGDISALEARADLIVCLLNSIGSQIPGKIYHAAGTNKRILVIVDGDESDRMKAYLESYHRYILCDNTVESIRDGIRRARQVDENAAPLPQFNQQHIARELIR